MKISNIALFILSATNIASAQSPPGVYPQVLNLLLVNYGGSFIQQGQVVSAQDTKNMPQLALPAGQTSANVTYLMIMLDIDENGANFKKRQASLNQPSDPQHANGQDTYLQAMIQDFQINTQTNDNGSPSVVSQSTGPAPYIAPSPDAADGHRYTVMLFEQPQGWTLPASLQQAVSQRKDFDTRKFMAATGFTVPVYGNWMIISPRGTPLTVSTASTLTTLPSGGPTITLPVTTTVPVSGAMASSTGSHAGGHSVISGVSTFYTTGFIGFTVLTSKVTTKYTVTAQLPEGSFTLIPGAATLTVTRAFSGVSHVSLSTYVTAATETWTESAVVDGQATTWTTTVVNVGYTTSAESVNAAPTPAPRFGLGGGAAAVAGLLGVALGAI